MVLILLAIGFLVSLPFLFVLSLPSVLRRWYGRFPLTPNKLIVVITGCDSGFGLATAEALAKLGFFVIGTVLTQEGFDNLNNRISRVIKADVTKQVDVDNLQQLITSILQENKNLSLWAVVNNAGIADGAYTAWTPINVFEKVMDVNYFGVIRMVKATFELLIKTPNSRIINVSSIAGLTGGSTFPAYAASKHAVEGFAKSLRLELAHSKVHVANVNPGFMKTPLLAKAVGNVKRHFDSLPIDIQNRYSEKAWDGITKVIDGTSQDPMLVVNLIVELIYSKYVPLNNYCGYGGMLRYSFNLPGPVREFLVSFSEKTPLKVPIH